jgi:hypothetical protein
MVGFHQENKKALRIWDLEKEVCFVWKLRRLFKQVLVCKLVFRDGVFSQVKLEVLQ